MKRRAKATEGPATGADLVFRAREVLAGLPDETDSRAVLDAWLGTAGVEPERREALLPKLLAELRGAGPLQPLFDDSRITEIMVNGLNPIWVEIDGRLQATEIQFRDALQLRAVIDRLLAGSGRRIDESHPTVDANLPDGSRLNAVLPPLASEPLLTIRKPRHSALDFAELVKRESLSPQMAVFLHAAVVSRCNILVTGAAGSGKTTVLSALCGLIPETERVVSIEDTRELRFAHPNWAAQECRPAVSEGVHEITLRDLLRNSLRMRPDRIMVGEVRGVESAEMIQAMNTGHAGSMATLHGSSASDALRRLEALLAVSWSAVEISVIRQWIVSAIDLVVHCRRDPSGVRRIVAVESVAGDLDRGGIAVAPLFEWSDGQFRYLRPVPERCRRLMREHGVQLDEGVLCEDAA